MSISVTKILICGLLFAFTLLSGVWLSHLGKPINSLVFTIHKLIAMATVVYLAVNVYNLYKTVDMQLFIDWGIIALSGLFYLALIITGALLSRNMPLPSSILKIHQVAPILALVSSSITIYLFASSNS